MKQKTVYVTEPDGGLFYDKKEALLHEEMLKLQAWYESNRVYSWSGSPVYWEDLCSWVNDNCNEVQKIVNLF